MVEIIYRPIQQLIILECIKYKSPSELLQSLILAPGQPAVLFWAEGVLFLPAPLSPSAEFFAEELTKGRMYWTSISFTLMPGYQDKILIEKGPEASVINVSSSPTLRQVAKWLKENYERL
ncbi:MAG: hypothetical protein QXO01_06760 [Nitrososphaerota archaeon]